MEREASAPPDAGWPELAPPKIVARFSSLSANARMANRRAEDFRFECGEAVRRGIRQPRTCAESADLFPAARQREEA
jgi:hypothetical protein